MQGATEDPFREWLLDFEYETGLKHDPRTVRVESVVIDDKYKYKQLKFCIWDSPDECYIMMKDSSEAFNLAYYLASNYDQDYDGLSYDDLIDSVENDLCKILSGEDYGCDTTGGGQYYWQEV